MSIPNQSQIPLFGRAWELVVNNVPPDGADLTLSCSAWDPETLRMVFEVNLPAFDTKTGFWYAKIDIYNLNQTLAAQLLECQGSTLTLKAGYQTGDWYGVIFEGEVYEVTFERVDVVDSRVTLMAYTGMREMIANPVSLRGSRNMTQIALIEQMCAAANTPITIGPIDPAARAALSTTHLSRARPVFGDPHDVINGIVSSNKMLSWYSFDGLGITRIGAASNTPEITYDGASGQIIGTPQQTQLGVNLNVLLDPRVRIAAPPQVIELVNTQISQLTYQIPAKAPILNPTGTYLAIGIQHNGDTRGETWRTEIVTLYSSGAQFAAIMAADSAPTQGVQQQRDPRSPR